MSEVKTSQDSPIGNLVKYSVDEGVALLTLNDPGEHVQL